MIIFSNLKGADVIFLNSMFGHELEIEIEVEVDSRCVTQLITSQSVSPNALINATKELSNRDWHISLNHINHEANFATDFVAKIANSLPLTSYISLSPSES